MVGLDQNGLQKLTKDFNSIGTKPIPIEDLEAQKKRKNRLLNQTRGQVRRGRGRGRGEDRRREVFDSFFFFFFYQF